MSVNEITNNYYAYAHYTNSSSKNSAAKTDSFRSSVTEAKPASRKESAVREFINRHPNEKHTVDQQVNAGRRVIIQNNAQNVFRSDMTMEEYKQFFTALMDSIPFDSSQKNDIEVWNISEKGWEQMKNDPDYEAWVLGYTVQDRSVHFPFASMPGYSPNYHTEHFGASIEEHIGQSVPMSSPKEKPSSDSDEESWWVKRHQKIKQLLAENAEIARERAAANQEILKEQWIRSEGASLSCSRLLSSPFLHKGILGMHGKTILS